MKIIHQDEFKIAAREFNPRVIRYMLFTAIFPIYGIYKFFQAGGTIDMAEFWVVLFGIPIVVILLAFATTKRIRIIVDKTMQNFTWSTWRFFLKTAEEVWALGDLKEFRVVLFLKVLRDKRGHSSDVATRYDLIVVHKTDKTLPLSVWRQVYYKPHWKGSSLGMPGLQEVKQLAKFAGVPLTMDTSGMHPSKESMDKDSEASAFLDAYEGTGAIKDQVESIKKELV